MRKCFSGFFVFVIGILFIFRPTIECSFLVTNTHREIENCENLLKLKLIRKMDDENLNYVFKKIADIRVDDSDNLYVCDQVLNQVRVFDSEWNYIQTIGKRGKGPGDMLRPYSLGFSPEQDLEVLEYFGMRIQLFDKKGHSRGIVKLSGFATWMGVTSTNEFILHEPMRTFKSRKLLYVIDRKGNLLREIGNSHESSEKFLGSEYYCIAMDDTNSLYVANLHAPVIRKYSSDGKLLQCITFEMPFEIPDFSVEVLDGGKDVKVHNEGKSPQVGLDGKRHKSGFKQWIPCIVQLFVDSDQRLYIVSSFRLLSEAEKKKVTIRSMTIGSTMSIQRPTIGIDEYPEYVRMMVFDRNGKIIATSPLKLPFSSPRVKGNRLYVVDDALEPGVWEYEFSIDVKNK